MGCMITWIAKIACPRVKKSKKECFPLYEDDYGRILQQFAFKYRFGNPTY